MTTSTRADVAASSGDDLDDFITSVLAASWLLVGISARSVDEVDDRVTLTQFRTLAVLADRGTTNLSRLAADLDVNASTSMRIIDRLVAAELVSRIENPATRREVIITLTEAGERLVSEVIARRRTDISGLVDAITSPHRAAIIEALRSFTAAAEAAGLRPAAPAALGW